MWGRANPACSLFLQRTVRLHGRDPHLPAIPPVDGRAGLPPLSSTLRCLETGPAPTCLATARQVQLLDQVAPPSACNNLHPAPSSLNNGHLGEAELQVTFTFFFLRRCRWIPAPRPPAVVTESKALGRRTSSRSRPSVPAHPLHLGEGPHSRVPA